MSSIKKEDPCDPERGLESCSSLALALMLTVSMAAVRRDYRLQCSVSSASAGSGPARQSSVRNC